MDAPQLKATRRTKVGKGAARQARFAGMVPGVVYGHQAEPQPLQVSARELKRLYHEQRNSLIQLTLDDDAKPTAVLLKSVSLNPLDHALLHVDFQAVQMDEVLTVPVAVHLVGDAIGVQSGGVLEQQLTQIEVACLAGDIPAAIEVDVTNLDAGTPLTAGEIALPEGATLVTDPNATVAAILHSSAGAAEATDAAAIFAEATDEAES